MMEYFDFYVEEITHIHKLLQNIQNESDLNIKEVLTVISKPPFMSDAFIFKHEYISISNSAYRISTF